MGPAHRADAGADTRVLTAALGDRLTAACDALRDEYTAGALTSYHTLLRGRAGVNRLFDTLRGMRPERENH